MFSIRNQLHNEPITVRLMVATNEPIIQFSNDQSSLNTTDIYLAISSGSCTIDWGDGNTTAATGASSTKYSNDYTAAGTGTYNIVIYGRTKNITDFRCFNEPISIDIAQFRRLTNLTYLYLFGDSTTGDIANFSGLTLLTYLDISDNSITGDIANLSELTSLTRLSLYGTSVSGDITNLSGLTSLTYLDLYGTSVSGDITNLSGLTSLTYSDISSSSIDTYTQGTLPDWEGTAIYIQDLGLDVTEVSDFLVDLDNATGSPGNGTLNISGTNAIPNAAGLTAKGNLEGKGWTVTVST